MMTNSKHNIFGEKRLTYFAEQPNLRNQPDRTREREAQMEECTPSAEDFELRINKYFMAAEEKLQSFASHHENLKTAKQDVDAKIGPYRTELRRMESELQSLMEHSKENSNIYREKMEALARSAQTILSDILHDFGSQYIQSYGLSIQKIDGNTVDAQYDGVPVRATLSDFLQITRIESLLPGNSVDVQFRKPQTHREFAIAMVHVRSAMLQLRKDPKLLPHLPKSIQLLDVGQGRFDTILNINGTPVKYCVTGRDVMRVTEEPSHELLEEYELAKNKLHSLRWRCAHLSYERILAPMSMKRENTMISREERMKTIQSLEKELSTAKAAMTELEESLGFSELENRANIRLLEVDNAIIVKEVTDPNCAGEIHRHYEDGGRRILSQRWRDEGLSSEEIYDANGVLDQDLLYSFASGKPWRIIRYENGKAKGETHYCDDGSYNEKDRESGNITFFSKDGIPIYVREYEKMKNGIIVGHTLLVDNDGGKIGTLSNTNRFRKEKGLSSLSPNEYLQYVADNIMTDAKKRIFLEQLMQYVHDSNNPNDPLEKGRETKYGDYWQIAYETVIREENGKMLGDCEDLAGLINEINQRQGLTSFIVSIGGMGPVERDENNEALQDAHALCIWVKPDTDGKTLCSGCTFGIQEATGETTGDAFAKLLIKYGTTGWMEGYKFNPKDIEVMYAPRQSAEQAIKGPIEMFTELPKSHTTALRTLCMELRDGMGLDSAYAERLMHNLNVEFGKTMSAHAKQIGGSNTEATEVMKGKIIARTAAEFLLVGYDLEWSDRSETKLVISKAP